MISDFNPGYQIITYYNEFLNMSLNIKICMTNKILKNTVTLARIFIANCELIPDNVSSP